MKTKLLILLATTLLAIALMAGCTATASAEPETEGTVESTEDIETKTTVKETDHTVPETTATETVPTTEATTVEETTATKNETQAAKTEKPAKTESTKPTETKREASPMTDGTPAGEAKPEEPAKAPAEQPEEKHKAPAEQPAPAPAPEPTPTEAPKPAETEAPKPVETEAPKHEHAWKEHYATRQVLVREAWVEEEYVGDETRDIVEEHTFCSCGADITGMAREDHITQIGEYEGHSGHVTRPVVVGQETVPVYIPVFHDAEYTTEQYVDYYYCDCGARK